MEHAALHALQLIGLVVALGGAVLVLALLRPAARRVDAPGAGELARVLEAGAASWVRRAALAAGFATLAGLVVQAAELRGQTVVGGVDPALAARLALTSTVGRLALLEGAALCGIAVTLVVAPRRGWVAAAVLAAVAATAGGLVSHAAAQPAGRVTAVATHLLHVLAAGVWLGVLVHLLAQRRRFPSDGSPGATCLLATVVARFSPWALGAVAAVALTGVGAALRYLGGPADLVASAWGLTLLVKLVLLAGAAWAGAVNFLVVRPALRAAAAAPGHPFAPGPDAPRSAAAAPVRTFGRMLELEVTTGLLAVAVAGVLGSVSPPGGEGAVRLSPARLLALWTPRLPSPRVVDPATFVDEAERTLDDLRYGEFMHNWSGVFVTAMGLLWLVQARGGPAADAAARLWPVVLVPFAVFISAFADPEVWVLRRVTVREALADPTVVEHQLGAVLLLGMLWLARRDRLRPAAERPMGRALPVLMILGGFLLLGHAHANLGATEELTALVNVQHAIIGGLGLLAGTVRWLTLRGLFPARVGNGLWPALVLAIGLFLALSYREVL